jgi:biopolymer transport protein ExbB
MLEGDVVKAMEICQQNPSAMSAIVLAAFQHIEEGFEAIQEAVTAASDLEQEKIQQRLNWISVCGNLGPSLGLLGTVQGMILTFQALASGGAGDAAALASSIGQALWTTAGGLIVSIPSVTMFYAMRNKANRLILKMQALTMEILNSLRNVSVDGGEAPVEEIPA